MSAQTGQGTPVVVGPVKTALAPRAPSNKKPIIIPAQTSAAIITTETFPARFFILLVDLLSRMHFGHSRPRIDRTTCCLTRRRKIDGSDASQRESRGGALVRGRRESGGRGARGACKMSSVEVVARARERGCSPNRSTAIKYTIYSEGARGAREGR